MKITRHMLFLGLFLIINGCTPSVTVIPPTGSLRFVIANASTEKEAVKLAYDRATRICILENQTIKIVDLDTIYQGIDAKQQTLAKLANNILPKSKTYAPYTPKDYTYKATVTFRCL